MGAINFLNQQKNNYLVSTNAKSSFSLVGTDETPLGEAPSQLSMLDTPSIGKLGLTNSRVALKAATGAANVSGSNWKNMPSKKTQQGEMSWYGGDGDGFNGKTSASGLKFQSSQYTIASFLPAGSIVRITNKANGKQCVAVVTDTGGFTSPMYNSRIADGSMQVATALGYKSAGTAQTKIEVLKMGTPNTYYSGKQKAQMEKQIQQLTDAQNKGKGITEIVNTMIGNPNTNNVAEAK